MKESILISIPVSEFQMLIINSVKAGLQESPIALQPEEDILLTIKEASELISLSVPTIYSLVHRAEIPVNKKGKRLYFSKFELKEWIKSGRRKTKEEVLNEREMAFYNSKKKR